MKPTSHPNAILFVQKQSSISRILFVTCCLLFNGLLFSQEYVFKDGIIQEKPAFVSSVKTTPITKAKGIIDSSYVPQVKYSDNKSSLLEKSSGGSGISNEDLANINLAPNAPKAIKSIESSIQISSNLYTGKQNINIPIYDFKSKDMSVPISLSQSAPNVKPGMKNSWVGFGWKLNAGGEIIRKINGKPDEGENGYFTTRDNKIINAKNLSRTDHYNGRRNKWDTSPDEFYFNFNGISGSFMIEYLANVQPHITSDIELDIRTIYSNIDNSSTREIIGFIVTDDEGYKYYFGKADSEAGDNTIEKVATKFTTTKRHEPIYGLFGFNHPTGQKVFNFAPFNSINYIAESGRLFTISLNDVVPFDNYTALFLTLGPKNDHTGKTKKNEDELTMAPVNIGWKLTKIEAPTSGTSSYNADFIKFEYDQGGWVEYEDVASRTTYTYKYDTNNTTYLRLKIRNPDYNNFCFSCPVGFNPPEFVEIDYPGRSIPERPKEWIYTSIDGIIASNYNQLPHFSIKYYPKTYKKTSTLKKIINKYGEYIVFTLGVNSTIPGISPLSSGNYGTAYTSKLLNGINLFDSNNLLVHNVADFQITKASQSDIIKIDVLTILDQKYKFEYDINGQVLDKIFYPTGGYTEYTYQGNTVKNVFSRSIENTLLKQSYVYKDEVQYFSPRTEVKHDGIFGGLVTVNNGSGIYGNFYSKGENLVFRTVETYLNDELQSIHKFSTPLTHKDEWNKAYRRGTDTNPISSGYHKPPPNLRDFERGNVETVIQYGKGDIKKTITTNIKTYETPKTLKAVRLGNYAYNGSSGYSMTPENRTYSYYHYYFPKIKTSKTETFTFYKNGEISKGGSETNFEEGYIKETKTTDSKGDLFIQRLTYPFSIEGVENTPPNTDYISASTNNLMNRLNIIKYPVEKTNYIKKLNSSSENLISSEIYLYDNNTAANSINLKTIKRFENNEVTDNYEYLKYVPNRRSDGTLTFDNRYENKVNHELYDGYGNVRQIRLENGTPITYIWGYGSRYAVAKIVGEPYVNVSIGLAQIGVNISTLETTTDEAFLIQTINQLRTALKNAMITSYTHKPLVGVTTITDPRGETSRYVYDDFGKLKLTKDSQGNVLKEYNYHYKNQ